MIEGGFALIHTNTRWVSLDKEAMSFKWRSTGLGNLLATASPNCLSRF